MQRKNGKETKEYLLNIDFVSDPVLGIERKQQKRQMKTLFS